MDLLLDDHVILVTGATSGIGRSTALELAGEGARVVAGGRDEERLTLLRSELDSIGADHLVVPGDLTTVEGLAAFTAAPLERHERIDGLVATVGSTPLGDFDAVDDEVWQLAFTGKLLASVRAVRAVLPHLRRRGSGRILVVAGNTAHAPDPAMLTSGAMNAALVNLVAATAQHIAREGLGINCLSPGPTNTARYAGMLAALMRREGVTEEAAADTIRSAIPAGRVAEPDEVAKLAALLVSPVSAHINGTNVVMDGAQTWIS
ncbi:MAG: SDR family oxidoreductase [Propionibacteriales bacterium]|nr:SDR family oxidoreductase [Propionibacteriales bacterium]